MQNTRCSVLAAFALAPLLMLAAPGDAAGQSGTAVSPFVSYVPSAVENPLVGMSLTFGGTTGLAFRAGADMSVENPRSTDAAGAPKGGYRPWAADADAMLFLGGLGGGATVFNRTLSPYLFTGIGMNGGDSAGVNIVRNGWSYGAGARIPLGLHADIFGEARWRLHQYVLPTSKNAPDSKSEFRFGLSFLVGGEPERPRPRRRYAEREYDDRPVAAAAPAPVVVVQQPPPQPAPTPVVVVQEPAPPPTVVVVQPEPERRRTVNVNVPIIIGSRSRSRHERDRVVVVTRPDSRHVTNPVWVPTTPVSKTKQRDPEPSLSCTTTRTDRRSSRSNAKVCVVKP